MINIKIKQLLIDNGARAECGLYYHGIFVATNISLMDEIVPLLKKLKTHLEDHPFYLTPELIELLEDACKGFVLLIDRLLDNNLTYLNYFYSF